MIAKPAEETPLIAAEAVRGLHKAGVPIEALALAARRGGSRRGDYRRRQGAGRRLHWLDAGRTSDRGRLAGRLTRTGAPVPLIAETGGLNAGDLLGAARAGRWRERDVVGLRFRPASAARRSAFSACRRTFHQMLEMLKGAMAELEAAAIHASSRPMSVRSSRPKRAMRSKRMSKRCRAAASR